jgi:hypothetical protein
MVFTVDSSAVGIFTVATASASVAATGESVAIRVVVATA